MSNAFSFRLSPQETEWVISQALPGETQHQTAQRLLRQLYANSFKPVDSKAPVADNQQRAVNNQTTTVDNIQDIVDSRLEAKLAEVESDIYARLADQLNAALEVRLGKHDRGSEELLQQQLAALQTERDELDQECNRLSAKVGDLDLAVQNLTEELSQARTELETRPSLPAGSESAQNHQAIALPDPAQLLNVLRQRYPKLKLTLKDVEAVLAALEEAG